MSEIVPLRPDAAPAPALPSVPEKASAQHWRALLLRVVPALADSDAVWLDITARALERWSAAEYVARLRPPVVRDHLDREVPNPWWIQRDKAEARAMKLLEGCGLSPASRAKLGASVAQGSEHAANAMRQHAENRAYRGVHAFVSPDLR